MVSVHRYKAGVVALLAGVNVLISPCEVTWVTRFAESGIKLPGIMLSIAVLAW